MERFGLARLFEDQLEAPSSPIYWVLGGLFLLVLLGGFYALVLADRREVDDRFHARIWRRYGGLLAAFSGLGAGSVAFSLLTVPFLSKRIWLVLALLGLLASGAHLGYFLRRRYPAARRAYEEEQRRRRSLPRPKPGGRKRRGKRR
jgi:hypothetical protein